MNTKFLRSLSYGARELRFMSESATSYRYDRNSQYTFLLNQKRGMLIVSIFCGTILWALQELIQLKSLGIACSY